MAINLSPRLRRLADWIPQGSVIVDVGTDHAYLPIYLLQTGISPHAYATDLRPGPLKNAEKDAERAGVRERLTLLLCDGLRDCDPGAVDTVVLAGMGGETMQGILDASPWALERRLLLQPQTKPNELRGFLAAHGLAILDASLVSDAGRIYQVWLAGPGQPREGVISPVLAEKRDPLLRAWTGDLIKRQLCRIQGLEHSAAPDPVLLESLRGELEELRALHRGAGG